VNITAGFRLYLCVAFHFVFDLLGKDLRLGPITRAVIPTGNFFVIDLNPQPFNVMKEIVGIMGDCYPYDHFRAFGNGFGGFDFGFRFIRPGNLPA
jgi:hypothetical protein